MRERKNSNLGYQGLSFQSNSSAQSTQSGSVLVSIIFGLFFVAIFFFSSYRFYLAATSGSWPVTNGHITRSEIKQTAGSGEASSTYSVDLEYAYSVKNKEYTGTEATFGIFDALPSMNRGKERADDLVGAYPPDKSVDVHYNPDNPAQACLEPGPTFGLYYWLSFCIYIIVGQVLYFVEKAQGTFSISSPRQLVRVGGMMVFVFSGFFILMSNFNPMSAKHQGGSNAVAATGDTHNADRLADDAYTAKYHIKDAAKVEGMYQTALDAIEKSYGKYSGKYYDKLVEAGSYCAHVGDIDKGIALEQKACDIWPRVCAQVNWHDHVLIVSDLSRLIISEKHDQKGAEKVLVDMATREAKVLGPDHPLVQNTYENLASFYAENNQKDKAEALYRKMLGALSRSVGTGSDEYARAQADLASLLLEENKKTEARALLESAYKSMKKSFGDQAPMTQWAAAKLREASS